MKTWAGKKIFSICAALFSTVALLSGVVADQPPVQICTEVLGQTSSVQLEAFEEHVEKERAIQPLICSLLSQNWMEQVTGAEWMEHLGIEFPGRLSGALSKGWPADIQWIENLQCESGVGCELFTIMSEITEERLRSGEPFGKPVWWRDECRYEDVFGCDLEDAFFRGMD